MLNTPGQDDHEGDLELTFEGIDGPDIHEDDCTPLDDGLEQVGYELFDWSSEDLDALDDALHREGLPHEWVSEGFEVVVHEQDEKTVDLLLAEAQGPEELLAEVDDGDDTDIKVLDTLFTAADRLRRDPTGDAVTGFLDAAEIIGATPPYGVDESAWERVTETVDELIDAYHSAAPEPVISGLVDRLYRFVRPLV